MSTTQTRIVDDVELPAPGRWAIDPGHTEVAFIGRHLVFTKVRGRFRGVEGFIDVAEEPDGSIVEVTIDVASVGGGDDARALVSKEIRLEFELETIRRT